MKLVKSRRNGFTVVELLIALLVLAAAIITMAGVMSQTTRMQGLALSRAEMTALAESKFEELRAAAAGVSVAPTSLTSGGSKTSDVADKWDDVTSASGRSYRRRWVVDPGPEGSVQVTMRVTSNRTSRQELPYLEFTTLIYVGE